MSRALLVGIDNYPSSPLDGCVEDAKAVAEILQLNEDGSPNIEIRCEENVKTRGALLQMIIELFHGEGDTAIFYFSGHGASEEFDTSLVTPDAKHLSLGVSIGTIMNIANKSTFSNRIIILDCCFAGAIGGFNMFGDSTAFINSGVTILASSKHDELSQMQRGRSLFTNLLLEALDGGAADLAGNITPASVYAFVDKALGAFDQRPVFKTNTTSFVSLRNVKPPIPLLILRKLPEHFEDQEMEYDLDPSFEFTNHPKKQVKLIEPYAKQKNVKVLQELQKYHSVGLVSPVEEEYMYFAAMKSKSCKLTALGRYYWRLAKENRIRGI